MFFGTSTDDRRFIVRWVAVCGLGLGAGLAAGLALAAPIEAVVGMMLVTPITLAIAGSVLGAGQWLALRSRPRDGLRWVVGSALGLGLGMTVGIVVVEMVGRMITGEQLRMVTIGPAGRVLALAVIGAAAGVAVGAGQAVLLRRLIDSPWRWAGRCASSFAIALPVSGTVAAALPGGLSNLAGFAVFLAGSGLLVGALSARAARDVLSRRGPVPG